VRNPVGEIPCGRNPVGGILHGRNPDETSANIYTCMRLTQKVIPYTLAHLTGLWSVGGR